MPVQIPPGFAQVSVEIRHNDYARPAYNVWGWDGAADYPSPEEAADAFLNTLQALDDVLDSQARFTQVRLEIGQDGGDPVVGFSTGPPVPGTRTSDSPPPALAVRGIKRTGLGGRRNRGSFFLPWAISRNAITETGQIAPAQVTATQAAMDSFFAQFNGTEYSLYILHGTGASDLPAPTEITSLRADPVISNQVRRQVKA